jgi:hypothetical protein
MCGKWKRRHPCESYEGHTVGDYCGIAVWAVEEIHRRKELIATFDIQAIPTDHDHAEISHSIIAAMSGRC